MKKKIVSIYLGSELLDKIDAERTNYSRRSFIEHMLLERFGINNN